MAWRAAIVVFLLIVVIWFVSKLVRPAHGHDWYEKACCSDGDCQPAPPGSVVLTDRGWLVYEGLTNPKGVRLMRNVLIPFGDQKIRPLPPGVPPGLHLCTSSGTVYCIYLDGGI
jgi:hypothetical protein